MEQTNNERTVELNGTELTDRELKMLEINLLKEVLQKLDELDSSLNHLTNEASDSSREISDSVHSEGDSICANLQYI